MRCPVCDGPLENREVAPCFDCGDDPHELDELRRGEHTYRWYRIYGQRIVLCDFCDADFASYDPKYFGKQPGHGWWAEFEPLERVEDPQPTKDGYCPSCHRRLAFLRFLRSAREHNAA